MILNVPFLLMCKKLSNTWAWEVRRSQSHVLLGES